MRFNPRNVIILLSAVFSALDFPESSITSEEFIMEEKLEDMLKEIYEDRCEIEEEESLDFINSFDVPKAEEVDEELVNEEENYACHVKEMLCDVDNISGEYKRVAVEYWRSGGVKAKNNKFSEIKISKSNINKTIATIGKANYCR